MANYFKNNKELIQKVRNLIPVLSNDLHKGSCGKLCIVGGSKKYCGAPYYAGISSLRCGSDLVTVICETNAAIPIKSYSPDLMVYDALPNDIDNIDIERYSCMVVGPGLGRDANTLDSVATIIEKARAYKIPLVIDGDGLYLINQRPDLIQGYASTILTPNAMEFRRLWNAVLPDKTVPPFNVDINSLSKPCHEWDSSLLATALGGITLVRKGSVDIITDGKIGIICEEKSCPRRCGGLGDILAGITGTYAGWKYKQNQSTNNLAIDDWIIAAYAGSLTTRKALNFTYNKHKYGMLASDVPNHIPNVIEHITNINNAL